MHEYNQNRPEMEKKTADSNTKSREINTWKFRKQTEEKKEKRHLDPRLGMHTRK